MNGCQMESNVQFDSENGDYLPYDGDGLYDDYNPDNLTTKQWTYFSRLHQVLCKCPRKQVFDSNVIISWRPGLERRFWNTPDTRRRLHHCGHIFCCCCLQQMSAIIVFLCNSFFFLIIPGLQDAANLCQSLGVVVEFKLIIDVTQTEKRSLCSPIPQKL